MISGYTADEAYDFLNKHFFGGKLPKIPIKWPRSLRGTTYMGRTMGPPKGGPATHIELNPKYKYSPNLWGMTLIHEMVHVEQWETVPNRFCHGPRFRARMRELAAKGIFDRLW